MSSHRQIVALPIYNEEANLAALLDFLLDEPAVTTIVAVDDRSSDASPAILADYASRFPQLRLITAAERSGQLAAWRLAALAFPEAEAICFIDADAMPAPGAVGCLFEALNAEAELVIVSGRVVPDAASQHWPAARFRAEALHRLRVLSYARDKIIGRFFAVRREWFLASAERSDIIANDAYLAATATRTGRTARYIQDAVCYYGEAQTAFDFAAQRQRADAGYAQLRAMRVLLPQDEPAVADYARVLAAAAARDPGGALAWIRQQIAARRTRAYRASGRDAGGWEAQPSTKRSLQRAEKKRPVSGRRPRIALTTRLPLGQAGGIESSVREIAPRLAAKRPAWDVHTMHAFKDVTRFNRIPLIGDVVAAIVLRIKASHHDIVLVNGAEYAWPFLLRKYDRARTIVVWHGTRVGEIPALVAKMSPAVRMYHALETWLQRFALCAAGSVAVSETTLAEIRTAYATAASIAVIPNGAPDIGERAATGSPSGHRVAWIGTSPYKKGLDIALAACERVRERYPDLELVVIGATVAGKQPWVRALGRRDHALSLQTLCGADVLLATTRYEGCSVAVIEALALGLPIVASPSVAWMIGSGGVAIEDFAFEHYARALTALFASPQTLAAKSRGARERARAFDWNVAADAYVRKVETCLSAS